MSATAGGVIADRYELRQALAEGGMGAVWEARDRLLDRPVAVKMPGRRLASDASFLERFWREARAAARLSHPNVAQVYDYGVEGGQPYLVMEYIPGETLAAVLAREGRVPSAEARGIAASVADALDAAHRAGVVHRDVKPGNVMLVQDGGVKVLDFGIASATANATMTGSGEVLGTPTYMAPEQASGQGATPASDVYALGVILYEMLAGRPPFTGDTALAVASAHVHRSPERLEGLAPDADPDLVEATRAAMEKDPARRPASGAAFAAMLRGEPAPHAGDPTTEVVPAAGEPEAAATTARLDAAGTAVLPPATEPEPVPGDTRRRRVGWIAAVAALLLAGVALIVLAPSVGGPGTTPASPLSPGGATPGASATVPSTPATVAPSTPGTSTPVTSPPPSPSQTTSTPSPTSTPTTTATPTATASPSG